MVRTRFLLFGKFLFHFPVRFFGSLRSNDPKPVQYAVHVRIHADERKVVKNRQDHFGRFYANSWQGGDFRERFRNFRTEISHEFVGRETNVFRFRLIIIH